MDTVWQQHMVLLRGSIGCTGTLTKPFGITGPGTEASANFLCRPLGFRTSAGPGNGGAAAHP